MTVEESSSQELKNIFEEFLGIMDKKLTLSKEDFEIKDKFNDIILNYYFKNSDHNIYGNKTLNQT